MVNATSKNREREFHSHYLRYFQRFMWLRPCSVYSHSLLNSNCRKLCKNKPSRVVPNARNTVLTQIRNSYMSAARHGRGGEERLPASTYSKQGQKVRPNRQRIYGNQRRKLSPKKADWKKVEANKMHDQVLQGNSQSEQQNVALKKKKNISASDTRHQESVFC